MKNACKNVAFFVRMRKSSSFPKLEKKVDFSLALKPKNFYFLANEKIFFLLNRRNGIARKGIKEFGRFSIKI